MELRGHGHAMNVIKTIKLKLISSNIRSVTIDYENRALMLTSENIHQLKDLKNVRTAIKYSSTFDLIYSKSMSVSAVTFVQFVRKASVRKVG